MSISPIAHIFPVTILIERESEGSRERGGMCGHCGRRAMGWMRNRCTTDRCSDTLGIGAMTYYASLASFFPVCIRPAVMASGSKSRLTLVLNTKNALEML